MNLSIGNKLFGGCSCGVGIEPDRRLPGNGYQLQILWRFAQRRKQFHQRFYLRCENQINPSEQQDDQDGGKVEPKRLVHVVGDPLLGFAPFDRQGRTPISIAGPPQIKPGKQRVQEKKRWDAHDIPLNHSPATNHHRGSSWFQQSEIEARYRHAAEPVGRLLLRCRGVNADPDADWDDKLVIRQEFEGLRFGAYSKTTGSGG
jgi:hypothetical protein